MQENNTQAAIDAGKAIVTAEQTIKYHGDLPLIIKPDGTVTLMTTAQDNMDERAPQPRSLAGISKILDEASLIAHCLRFRDTDSALFANRTSILAVYDYHRPIAPPAEGSAYQLRDGNARWQRHRAEYTPQKAPEWKTWIDNAGKLMSQAEFADFLEANVQDLAGPEGDRKVPTPADLCTMTLTLKVTQNDVLDSQINRTTGEYTLIAKQEQQTTGSTVIPKEFDLFIPLYERGEQVRVTCKFRMRKEGAAFKFGWVIPTAERMERQAFEAIAKRIAEATALPLFYGQPEQ